MNKCSALFFCLILLLVPLTGCFGNSDDEDKASKEDSIDSDNDALDQDDTIPNEEPTIEEPIIEDPYAITCPDGSIGTLQWAVITCAEPDVFRTTDVSNDTQNLTMEWYDIAVKEWGNYGPVEVYIIGNDVDAASELEDFYCDRHKALDSNWNEQWDCANDNYQIFTNYVEDGGAAISTQKRPDLDYDFMAMVMSSKYPGPEEEDYKPVVLHEYFHIFQHSHITSECTNNDRDVCLRDDKMGGEDTPWFSEGGAEFMAQSLYSKQDGVRNNYLKDVMRHKLEISLEGYKSQDTPLEELTYSSPVNVYDIGAWFIAYLIDNEGEEAFLEGFYGDLDDLGFDSAFEKNFGKSKAAYLSEYELFLDQDFDTIMTLFDEPVAYPEQTWFTSYGGTGEESHGHYILACSDGGFLQIGETGFIPNTAKILVVKVNSTGQFEWKQEFGDVGHNLGNNAIETADGYVIVGALNEDSSVIKLNKSTGELIFSESFDNGGSDAIESIIEVDNGFIGVGYIDAEDRDNTFFTEGKGHLTFIDDLGLKTSEMSLDPHMAHAYRIDTHNNQIFISGLTEEAFDYALMKMTMAGEIIWSNTYGGDSYDHNFAFDISPDGAVYLSGHTLSGTANWDTYTLKLDNDGNVVWENTRGNPRGFNPQYIHDEVWGAAATPDGGVIIVAGTGDEYSSYSECNDEDCSDAWRVYLIKYDSNGDLVWEMTLAGEENSDWAGEDICLTSDGGAVVAVDNGEFGFLKISPA